MELQQTGELKGRLRDPDGNLVRDIDILLKSAVDANRSETRYGPFDGRYEIESLGPGRYILRAVSNVHHPVEMMTAVRSGEETVQDLILEPETPAGLISGTVYSCQEACGEGRVASIASTGDRGRRFETFVRWKDGDEQGVGYFRFKAIPKGEYRLWIHGEMSLRLEPRHMVVSPTTEHLVFRCKGPEVLYELSIQAVDAETRDSIGGIEVGWLLGPAEYEHEVWSADSVVCRARGSAVAWRSTRPSRSCPCPEALRADSPRTGCPDHTGRHVRRPAHLRGPATPSPRKSSASTHPPDDPRSRATACSSPADDRSHRSFVSSAIPGCGLGARARSARLSHPLGADHEYPAAGAAWGGACAEARGPIGDIYPRPHSI